MIQNQKLIERFLRYVRINTQSAEDTGLSPSTAAQFDLARLLVRELEAMGAQVDFDDEHCYVYAVIPGEEPAIGFIAHMDTSPAAGGADVKPRFIMNYSGHDRLLDEKMFPELLNHIGEDLIATDGTTLRGADDKAGIAEIMNLAEYLLSHPKEKHRTVAIAFTPDEETGDGTKFFHPERFAAKEAYTVDGGKLGVIEYECFNAAGARADFYGKSVHTGDAKNTMINASSLAMQFASMLPPAEVPEHTEGYEGFYHLDEMEGRVDHAVLRYIIRDHDRIRFEERKEVLRRIAAYMNEMWHQPVVELTIRDQYYNMLDIMKDHMDLVEKAERALASLGVTPRTEPIRGGTDGAALCFRGIPCPNLCTGGYNYHGPYEYASVQEMEKTAELLILLAHGN